LHMLTNSNNSVIGNVKDVWCQTAGYLASNHAEDC